MGYKSKNYTMKICTIIITVACLYTIADTLYTNYINREVISRINEKHEKIVKQQEDIIEWLELELESRGIKD